MCQGSSWYSSRVSHHVPVRLSLTHGGGEYEWQEEEMKKGETEVVLVRGPG